MEKCGIFQGWCGLIGGNTAWEATVRWWSIKGLMIETGGLRLLCQKNNLLIFIFQSSIHVPTNDVIGNLQFFMSI